MPSTERDSSVRDHFCHLQNRLSQPPVLDPALTKDIGYDGDVENIENDLMDNEFVYDCMSSKITRKPQAAVSTNTSTNF